VALPRSHFAAELHISSEIVEKTEASDTPPDCGAWSETVNDEPPEGACSVVRDDTQLVVFAP
jgi:hypothetical protein